MMNTNIHYGTRYRLDMNGMFAACEPDMIIEPSSSTPFVKYSKSENIFMIKGNSSTADIDHFYFSLIGRAKAHLNERRDLDVILFFNMFNPTTAKVLFDFFKFIRDKKKQGVKVNITWGAEADNEEMLEAGNDFAELYDLDFRYLVV